MAPTSTSTKSKIPVINSTTPTTATTATTNAIPTTNPTSSPNNVTPLPLNSITANHVDPPAPAPATSSVDFDQLIQSLPTSLPNLQSSILLHSIPFTPSKSSTESSLRGRIWQALLNLPYGEEIDTNTPSNTAIVADQYIELIEKGPSRDYEKIRNDSFRTFKTDENFHATVKEEELIRVLNSFVHQFSLPTPTTDGMNNSSESTSTTVSTTTNIPRKESLSFHYVQGLNAIAAPFLYTMPELFAYNSFSHFVTDLTPLYWISSHIGVNCACRLVDDVLEVVDPELFNHLKQSNLDAYLYAFSTVSSFCCSVPPFSEVLHCWDFLLAFGVHWNVLLVVAQILLIRKDLLASEQPKTLLDYRHWPPLRARPVLGLVVALFGQLPDHLSRDIQRHTFDHEVVERLTKRSVDKI